MPQSTTNSPGGAALSQVPPLRSFELDQNQIGRIRTSVNQFRGAVSMPIELLSLPGRQGLDVKVSALYTSNISIQRDTWNVEQPTGILGLGWEMPFDQIAVDKRGSNSPTSDVYYLLTGGSASPLVQDGDRGGGVWSFQLRNYEFWEILYDTGAEQWRIVKEDGSVHLFGGRDPAASAIQWGVGWGNWLGSSSVRAGQQQYAAAWNLASITSAMGQRVSYGYQNVSRKVGSQDGLEFTQASYLSRIVDSYGRATTFLYGQKYGAENPSPRGIVEYQARNAARPEPNAYQDKYQTLYLDAVEVANPQGEPITRVQLTYDFVNFAPTGEPSYPLMWKRCLQSVFQQSPDGRVIPSFRFEYAGRTDVNPGALKSVTYPQGAVGRFTYKNNPIAAPRKVQVQNPLPGGTPGVWQGTDSVVFTFARSEGGLRVLVYSWNGRWISTDITASSMASATVDPASLRVFPQAGWLAISFRNPASQRDELYLYRQDPSSFGRWELYLNGPQLLPLRNASAGPSTFVAGNDFVIACNKDYSGDAFRGFSWDWRTGQWSSPGLLPSSADARAANGVALAAFQNYYIVAFYFSAQRQAKFQVLYRDSQGGWHGQSPWTNGNLDVTITEGQLLFTWALQPTYAVATYVTGSTNEVIRYSLRTFQWNESFFVLNSAAPLVVDLETAVNGDKPQLELFRTLATGAFVANNLTNLRTVGGELSTGSNLNWLRQSFQTPSTQASLAFASGEDVAVLCASDQGTQRNTLLVFDPNVSSMAGWSFPAIAQDGKVPTVAGDYMTVGRRIYFRGTSGAWQELPVQLLNLGDEQSVQNRAPSYIAYQDGNGSTARAYVVALRNGAASAPVELSGGPQKVYVPADQMNAGTLLAGPRFLVTYPSASSFQQASTFSLYNLEQGDLGEYVIDTPVGYLEIEDAYDAQRSYCQSFFYGNSDTSQIAYNPTTGLAQYPAVTSVPMVRSLDATPPSVQPQGRTVFYYSNGLSPQAAIPYPHGWIYNYQNVLNGMLLAQYDYSALNALVSSQVNYWMVYTLDARLDQRLFGGYVRLLRTASMRDGVEQSSWTEYDRTTGLQRWQEVDYGDSQGVRKRLRTENTYAWQVPEYAAAFLELHDFSSIAQATKSVSEDTGAGRVYIQSQATTYKDWAAPGAPSPLLASWQVFQWTAPGPNAPVFDFSGGDRTDWLLASEILRRSSPAGMIEEQLQLQGFTSSFLYDRDQRYLVAKFPSGSLSKGEVSYTGFESYETDQGWQLGSKTSVIPNPGHPQVDAHTGERSVRLEPGATGDAGLSRRFQPSSSSDQRRFVFSAWVKKPEGFDPKLGPARFRITVDGQAPIDLAFPEQTGTWVYAYQVIELPEAGGGSIEVRAENENTGSFVLVDDLRFSPWSCLFEATGYDTRFWVPDAQLGANGESLRTVHDEFQQPVFFTNAADQTSKIAAASFSRQGNQGTFSTAVPNLALTMNPAGGGELTTFTRGDEWRRLWRAAPEGAWRVADGRLVLDQPSAEGTLAISDPRYSADWSLGVRFHLRQAPARPMGIRVGGAVTIQWSPSLDRWQLLGEGTPLAPDVKATLFTVPAAPYTGQLDAGQISPSLRDLFYAAGYPLPPGSTVTAGDGPSQRWVLTAPDGAYFYSLVSSGDLIDVSQPCCDWQLVVGTRSLVFWAGGRRIFSHVAQAAFSGPPELFFGDAVAISALVTGLAPQVQSSFSDSCGNPRQVQGLLGERASVSQTFYDEMSRLAVRTKPAYVDPAVDRPLLAYRQDFAVLDWQTGKMTGLVNDAYPLDGGYPYSRRVYETSALERVVEQGLPGELFRVGAHSTRYTYGSDPGPAGPGSPPMYFRTTITDPNGNVIWEVSSLLEQILEKVSLKHTTGGLVSIRNTTRFDDAGNPVELRSPNFFAPSPDSSAADWAILQAFDYAGRVLSSRSGTQGPTELVYDRAGNLRFQQDAQGASAGTFNYWKYDSLGRPAESGYTRGTWDRATLQRIADTDPAWPADSLTWRKRLSYDGGQDDPFSVGRVVQILVNNGDAGQAGVTERFAYDVAGNTVESSLTVSAFTGAGERVVGYGYDNIGNVVRVTYPEIAGGTRPVFHYGHDSLGRVTAIAEAPDLGAPLATFTYDATGRAQQETLSPGAGIAITRSMEFNPPLWPTCIRDKDAGGSVAFSEQISYTEGGFAGAGYFDGTVASTSYASTGNQPADYRFQYAYSSLGEIETAQSPGNTGWDLGVKNPVSYDANGNFQETSQGDQPRSFRYFAGTQRLQRVVDPSTGAALAEYQYDASGNATRSITAAAGGSAGHRLTLTYDPATGMTRRIDDEVGPRSLAFQYGGSDQRVLKEVREGDKLVSSRLYVRGTGDFPIYEATSGDQGTTEVLYVFGPGGLLAMRKGGQQYAVLKDHLGSVRRVADAGGVIVASYDYLPFGALSRSTEPEPGFMPYLFTGHELDREVGLYNFRARFYAAEIGRFLSVDPRNQFFSPYLYAANNPVLYIDPTGTFSWKSFFSALGGALIGALEILVGVVIDAIAGVLEVVTGGLSTGASLALASLAGAFFGAGISAISYSVFNFNDFSWKDYGIQMGIGALVGAASFGFGVLGAAAAEGVTGVQAAIQAGQQVSNLARAASFAINGAVNVAGGVATGVAVTAISDAAAGITPGADLGWSALWSGVTSVARVVIPSPGYKAGWGEFGKRVVLNVAKNEVIGVSVNVAKNAAAGDPLNQGLLNTVVSGALWGTVSSVQARPATKQTLENFQKALVNSFAF
jgi:RHS repeat-associated protein